MANESLFQLLNPFVFLLLAGGFAKVSRFDRHTGSASWFAMAYFCAAIGFCLDFSRSIIPMTVAVLGGQLFYFLAVSCTAIGFRKRAQNSSGMILIALMAGAAYAASVTTYIMQTGFWPRILLTHTVNGLIFGYGVWGARKQLHRQIDQLIFLCGVLYAAQFLLRPSLVYMLAGVPQVEADYASSPMVVVFHLTVGCLALLMAVLLLYDYTHSLLVEYRDRSLRDPLTGIYNRSGFQVGAASLRKKHRTRNTFLCLIMIDIDHFKGVNDTYGHALGDKVIVGLAHLLQAHTEDCGLAGRIGGEEFAILQPVESLADAHHVAEVLRRRFQRIEFMAGEQIVTCTASFGVSLCQDFEPLEETMGRADNALYLAKESGRNRVLSETDITVTQLRATSARLKAARKTSVGVAEFQ